MNELTYRDDEKNFGSCTAPRTLAPCGGPLPECTMPFRSRAETKAQACASRDIIGPAQWSIRRAYMTFVYTFSYVAMDEQRC